MTDNVAYDLLIKNARVFNQDDLPVTEDIAVRNGRIVSRGKKIAGAAKEIIDGTGKWAMPGLFDIHTHYDLELELAPALPESTRHGTTSVVIANCSLGLAFGNQRQADIDPVVDCYARVENLPKSLLRSCADKLSWESPSEYIAHLEALNLGPNVVTMMPHSMMRIDAMGFGESISRDPTHQEITKMRETLRDGLKCGYAGFSTDSLPFHYLANQPNCHKTIPTQFAAYKEIKALTDIVREEGAVWQATPPKDNPLDIIKMFLLSCARFHGRPLKTTVVAALDVATNRNLVGLAKLLPKVLNSRLLKGQFFMQALGAPFKTWSDGAITPLAEEIPELRILNETELEDRATRLKILSDPEYVRVFREMWLSGKQGFNLARLRRFLRMDRYAFDRDLKNMKVERCEVKAWIGLSFHDVYQRVRSVQNHTGGTRIEDKEKQLIQESFAWVRDEVDFVLQILRSFDTDLSWSTVSANRELKKVRSLLMNPNLIPGFNDSGAHITNMAFYDVNLRSLKLAAQGGERDVAYMVKRLTKDPADLFNVERGTIGVGDVADLILIDPKRLADYDGDNSAERIYRTEFDHEQLVNRSDGVVPLVVINGKIAWRDDHFSATLGSTRYGDLLKPRQTA